MLWTQHKKETLVTMYVKHRPTSRKIYTLTVMIAMLSTVSVFALFGVTFECLRGNRVSGKGAVSISKCHSTTVTSFSSATIEGNVT